jgi:hypothetical protein
MSRGLSQFGRVAQLGEHLLCKQGVTGSIPVTSTTFLNYVRRVAIRLLSHHEGRAGRTRYDSVRDPMLSAVRIYREPLLNKSMA